MLEAREEKVDKLIAAGHEQIAIKDKRIAAKNKKIIKLIAQLKAPKGGNSGNGGGKKVSTKLNGNKAKCVKLKGEQNKAKKKAKLCNQLAARKKDVKTDKKDDTLTKATCGSQGEHEGQHKGRLKKAGARGSKRRQTIKTCARRSPHFQLHYQQDHHLQGMLEGGQPRTAL